MLLIKNVYKLFALLFCFIFLSLNATTVSDMIPKENKIHVVIAMPFQEGKPFEPNWYSPAYFESVKDLLPEEKYEVTSYFVSFQNIPKFLDDMHALYKKDPTLRVLNFCDGGEWDGYPGISVLTAWEKHPVGKLVPMTGSNAEFIYHSDNKYRLNEHLKKAQLQTLPEALIPSQELATIDLKTTLEKANLQNSWPLFVKLNIGAGSLGIGSESICHNLDQLKKQLNKMHASFPTNEHLLVLPYLPGPEYTFLLINNKVYMGIRRDYQNPENIFHEDYLEGRRPVSEEVLYHSAPKEAGDFALKAVHAIPGKHHYTRVDMRGDGKGNLFVIDVNDRPGFGTPSTVKYMLEFHHLNESQLLEEIILSAPIQS